MDCRLGVVALGDSITNGGGELQWGVALQSWALWTARGLGLPYTGVAIGRRARGRRDRPPAARRRGAGGRELGPRLPVRRRQRRPRDRLRPRGLRARPPRRARVPRRPLRSRAHGDAAAGPRTAPRRPPGGGQARSCCATPRATGALVLDLREFRGRNLVMADHVHPTAFGQVAIAERALAVLAAAGMPVRARPSALISPSEQTRWNRLRGDRDVRLPPRQGVRPGGGDRGARTADSLSGWTTGESTSP